MEGRGRKSLRAEGDLAEAADGVGEEEGGGGAEVGEGEDALGGAGVGLEEMLAVDAGEQAAGEGRSIEFSGDFDEEIVVHCFG